MVAEPGLGSTSVSAPVLNGGGVLARIRQVRDQLHGTSGRVADYVLATPWEVRGLSINDLAARVGVSVNSINRFARDLGMRGYREFSQGLILDLGRVLGGAYGMPASIAEAVERDDDELAIVYRTLALEMQCLQETVHSLDRDMVRRAVDALSRAESVLFIGTGAGMAVCAMAAYRLTVLGLRASYTVDPSVMIAEIHLLGRDDVLFAVSQHGAAPQVVQALRHARQRGVPSICVTAAPGSPAARAADIHLVSFGHDAVSGSEQFASRVVTAAVIEALIVAMAWRRFGGTPAHVEELLRAQRELQAQPQPRAERTRHVRPQRPE